MQAGRDFLSTPELDCEAWRDTVRTFCGRYSPGDIEPKAFSGRVRARCVCGFMAMDLSCNAHRVERTYHDVRLDGREHYYAIFQIAGHSTIVQGSEAASLTAGDVALVDAAKPVTYLSGEEGNAQWLSLQLPRRSLVSHLGCEPRGGSCRHRDAAGVRPLYQLVLDCAEEERSITASGKASMCLAFYDLLGALFAPLDPPAGSLHADKLFVRACNIIKDRFADPAFGPCEVATEVGISLRYLQKLFTARSSTCTHYINSVRLDHAARLLRRRASLNTNQPLSQIAYDSGFNDYVYFARRFRGQFGHPPGAHQGSE